MAQEGKQGSTAGNTMKSLILKGGLRLLQIGLASGPSGWLLIGGAALALVFFSVPILIIVSMLSGGGGGINFEPAEGVSAGSPTTIDSNSPTGCPIQPPAVILSSYAGHISRPGSFDGDINAGTDLGDNDTDGTPVYSTLSGEVTRVAYNDTSGYRVGVTNHESGYYTYYAHLTSDVRVQLGDTVSVGTHLGFQDKTGNASTTPSHVHYGVLVDGGSRSVNPEQFMTVEGGFCTGSVTPAPGGELDFYIKYGDISIVPTDPQSIKNIANANWPSNKINDSCPGGVTCWDYVIQQSRAKGVSPAFSISIWWEKGGFGGAGAGDEFGVIYCSQHNTVSSLDCFLDFTAREHPYSPSDPSGSFTEWVRYFCGPNAVPICSNNPNFLNNIKLTYNSVAPGAMVTTGGI